MHVFGLWYEVGEQGERANSTQIGPRLAGRLEPVHHHGALRDVIVLNFLIKVSFLFDFLFLIPVFQLVF